MDGIFANRKVRIFLPENDATATMMMADSAPGRRYPDSTGSALQNPELSEIRLASMLRRALRGKPSRKSQHRYWEAFMTGYISTNANCNAGK